MMKPCFVSNGTSGFVHFSSCVATKIGSDRTNDITSARKERFPALLLLHFMPSIIVLNGFERNRREYAAEYIGFGATRFVPWLLS